MHLDDDDHRCRRAFYRVASTLFLATIFCSENRGRPKGQIKESRFLGFRFCHGCHLGNHVRLQLLHRRVKGSCVLCVIFVFLFQALTPEREISVFIIAKKS